MNFNPLKLIGKVIMTVNIQGQASGRAADKAVLTIAWAVAVSLVSVSLGVMVWLMK